MGAGKTQHVCSSEGMGMGPDRHRPPLDVLARAVGVAAGFSKLTGPLEAHICCVTYRARARYVFCARDLRTSVSQARLESSSEPSPTIPRRRAVTAATVRFGTPSFARMRPTWT